MPVVTPNSYLTKSDFIEINRLSKYICKQYPNEYYIHDINIIPIVEDSITKHYYGDVPKNTSKLYDIRLDHVKSSIVSSYLAKKISDEWSPTSLLSNMQVYSNWAPIYLYYKKKT